MNNCTPQICLHWRLGCVFIWGRGLECQRKLPVGRSWAGGPPSFIFSDVRRGSSVVELKFGLLTEK